MIPSKTDDELHQLALAVFRGEVFTDRHVDDLHMVPSIFMILNFLDDDALATFRTTPPGMIYEYMREAGERSVNGYPMFMSMKLLNQADAQTFAEKYERIVQAVEATQTSAPHS